MLEIFPPEYSTGNFFTIASAIGLDYYCAVGGRQERENARHVRDHDIIVGEEILESFLSRI